MNSTQPPPPMPALSPRDDSPRAFTRPGPDSRYWRARSPASLLGELAASVAISDAIERIELDQWFADEPVPVCECEAPCATEHGEEVIRLRGRAYCSRECTARAILWAQPSQDQSPATVRRVEEMIEASFTRARGSR